MAVGRSRYVSVDSKECWATAISSAWYVFFSMGIIKSEAVIYVGTMEMLGVSREEASWPPTLALMLSQLAGPAYGILCIWLSERFLLIAASLMASISVMVCSFATSITAMSILLGLIHGFGVAAAEVLPFVIVSRHFEKYRASVISLLYVITAVSGFIMPLISEYFRVQYGFRGCLLLLGAVDLNLLVGSIIVNRLSPDIEDQIATPAAFDKKKFERRFTLSFSESFHTTSLLMSRNSHRSSIISQYDVFSRAASHRPSMVSEHDLYDECIPEKAPLILRSEREAVTAPEGKSNRFVESLKTFISISFIHITLSRAMTLFAVSTMIMIVMDFATDNGLTGFRAVSLVTAFSLGDLGSRMSTGWIVDMQVVSCATAMLVGFFVQAVALVVMGFYKMYIVLLLACFVVGLTGGGRTFLATVMITEEFDMDNLALNLGVMHFFSGLTFFLRPPIIGYVRDVVGSYDGMLITFAIINFAFTLSWSVKLLYDRRRLKRWTEI